jgi:hypothetical protein
MVTIDMALWQLLLKWRLGSFAQLATWQFSKTKLKWRLGRYGAPSLAICDSLAGLAHKDDTS